MSILVDVSLRCSAGESSKQCEVNRLSKSCASELFISLRMPLCMLGAADGGVAAKSSGRIGNILSSIKWISDANWLYLVPMRNAALWGTAKNTCTDMGTASRLFGCLLLLFLSDTAARKSKETLTTCARNMGLLTSGLNPTCYEPEWLRTRIPKKMFALAGCLLAAMRNANAKGRCMIMVYLCL